MEINRNKVQAKSQKNHNFAELVRSILQTKGWTQTQLAVEVGVYQGTVSMWLSGRKRPHPTHLRRLHELAAPVGDPLQAVLALVEADPVARSAYWWDGTRTIYADAFTMTVFDSTEQLDDMVRRAEAMPLITSEQLQRMLTDKLQREVVGQPMYGAPLLVRHQAIQVPGHGPLIVSRVLGECWEPRPMRMIQ